MIPVNAWEPGKDTIPLGCHAAYTYRTMTIAAMIATSTTQL